MLTVACVLKSGGIYDATWVARLRDGVARHLPIQHRFVCLSDVDVPCERIALDHDWPGWWSKIELFKLAGPVLAFDLDTAIVGDLSDVGAAALDCHFVMLRDFYRLGDGMGSGVMAWSGKPHGMTHPFNVFASTPEYWMEVCGAAGDQNFIERITTKYAPPVQRWQDVVADQIVSYKVHCRNGIPAGARVVCLHGRPKFADMPATDPVRQAWEMAA